MKGGIFVITSTTNSVVLDEIGGLCWKYKNWWLYFNLSSNLHMQ
jgi:hypothetical protein